MTETDFTISQHKGAAISYFFTITHAKWFYSFCKFCKTSRFCSKPAAWICMDTKTEHFSISNFE